MAILVGTAAADSLAGGDENDELYGLEGDDWLGGGDGHDWLDGGEGADTMAGGLGDDIYVVDDAGDVIAELAGEGWDVALLWGTWLDLGSAHVEEIWSQHSLGVTILGSAGVNWMFADSGDDWLEGRGGNDYLVGGGGSDRLDGGAGDDHLRGGEGADTMIGGSGNDLYEVDDAGDVVTEAAGGGIDTVRPYLGDFALPGQVENADYSYSRLSAWSLTGNGLANTIVMGRGAGVVNGGGGSDTVVYANEWGPVLVDLATGEMGGGAADDVLVSIENLGGSGLDDELRGTSGANLLDGRGGADLLIGRGGNDVYLVDDPGDVIVELAGEGTDEVRVAGLAFYAMPDEVENLRYVGSAGATLVGNGSNNDMVGGAGADWISGLGGHDYLSGGAGDDLLEGGDGADTLSGGAGADLMEGGEGNDAYIVDNAGDVVVELPGGGDDQVYATLASYTLPDEVETLRYNGYGPFSGTGNALANLIVGGSGADILAGGAGDDVLRGQSGNDQLLGGEGADSLYGGAGADTLSGGAGADRFLFGAYESGVSAPDRILDFVPGEDSLDLSAIDADLGTAGNQAFAFIGATAFSGIAGELRVAFDGADTLVEGDVDGDGAADFRILLTGPVTPLATDFVL
jgi:Ca2+-binding RTX toxin-like protein